MSKFLGNLVLFSLIALSAAFGFLRSVEDGGVVAGVNPELPSSLDAGGQEATSFVARGNLESSGGEDSSATFLESDGDAIASRQYHVDKPRRFQDDPVDEDEQVIHAHLADSSESAEFVAATPLRNTQIRKPENVETVNTDTVAEQAINPYLELAKQSHEMTEEEVETRSALYLEHTQVLEGITGARDLRGGTANNPYADLRENPPVEFSDPEDYVSKTIILEPKVEE